MRHLTMLKLFYAPGTCALASHIALAEAGAAYETQRMNLKQGEQRDPAYLALNPKGRVPTLITERGPLTETPAILAYIAQSFPAARLAPLDDPFAFAEMQAFNAFLCATVHVAHAHGPRASRWSDDAAAQATMKAKVGENMRAAFELIEPQLGRGAWVLGDRYSVADAYLFTLGRWLEIDGVDIATLPLVHAHHQRMLERPAVQRVLAEQSA
jgi:glutathione S-transferase